MSLAEAKARLCFGGFSIIFAVLHFMQHTKIQALAEILGIHRVSFARLARLKGVPGLRRTLTNRWMVADKEAFDRFAKQYRETAALRTRKISMLNRDSSNKLRAAVRFSENWFPLDAQLRADWEEEIRRLADPKAAEYYSTTQMAQFLGVTTQSIRDWREKIPGAKTIGQRLIFEKSSKLELFLLKKTVR
jgi:hypothetical protein